MSGYPDDDLDPLDQAQVNAAAGTNAVAALQAGHPFALLLAEDDRLRAVELEELLDVIADTQTRFARATNPLRARLTLERLLIQVIQGGPESTQGDAGTIIRRIAERRGDETRVILVIERAETLHPEVLQFFGQTAPYFPDGVPKLQILFVGRPEFQRMLEDPDAGFDEQTAQLEAYRPREVEPDFATPAEMEVAMLPARPIQMADPSLKAQILTVWNRSARTRYGLVGGILVGTLAVAFAIYIATTGDEGPIQVDTGTALLRNAGARPGRPRPARPATRPPRRRSHRPAPPRVRGLPHRVRTRDPERHPRPTTHHLPGIPGLARPHPPRRLTRPGVGRGRNGRYFAATPNFPPASTAPRHPPYSPGRAPP